MYIAFNIYNKKNGAYYPRPNFNCTKEKLGAYRQQPFAVLIGF
jgi:hypothetical protein